MRRPTSSRNFFPSRKPRIDDSEIVKYQVPLCLQRSSKKGLSYKTCIASGCFEGSIKERIEATGQAGFDSIEIMSSDLDEASPQQILNYCNRYNISVANYQPFKDLEGYVCDQEFEEKLRHFESFVTTCKALDAELIVVCANCDKGSTEDHAVVIPQLRKAALVAEKYGVRIAYENLSWAAHNNQIHKLVDVIKEVDMDNFGLCLDLFHININRSSLDCIQGLQGKLFFVQFCDSPLLSTDLDILEHARNHRVFPFQGCYKNLYSCMHLLARVKYNGPLSLEVFNQSYKENVGQCSYVADDAFRSLVYLQASYSDMYRGTHKLAGANISGITCASQFDDWSSIQLGFVSSAEEAQFEKRLDYLGFSEIQNASTVSNLGMPTAATFRVKTRLAYYRLFLAVRIALGFEPINDLLLNITNTFNLPMQSVFSNERGVTIVITLL